MELKPPKPRNYFEEYRGLEFDSDFSTPLSILEKRHNEDKYYTEVEKLTAMLDLIVEKGGKLTDKLMAAIEKQLHEITWNYKEFGFNVGYEVGYLNGVMAIMKLQGLDTPNPIDINRMPGPKVSSKKRGQHATQQKVQDRAV